MVDRDSSTEMASIMDTKQMKRIFSLLAFTYDTFHLWRISYADGETIVIKELPQDTHRLAH